MPKLAYENDTPMPIPAIAPELVTSNPGSSARKPRLVKALAAKTEPTDPTLVAAAEERDARLQVHGEAAEAFIQEKRLGERIKYLRLKKSMGLVELGRHTGLSASFLSQLETGRVVPTLRNLARIAMVFSKDLNYFFEPEPKTLFRIHRGKERVRLPQTGTDEPSYYFESLGYMVPDRQLDPYFAEFLPNMKGRKAHQHAGCEFLYLLSGKLEILHGEHTNTLEGGDAVYFDSNTPHSYSCVGDEPAKALIVTLQFNTGLHSGIPHIPTLRPKTPDAAAMLRNRPTENANRPA